MSSNPQGGIAQTLDIEGDGNHPIVAGGSVFMGIPAHWFVVSTTVLGLMIGGVGIAAIGGPGTDRISTKSPSFTVKKVIEEAPILPSSAANHLVAVPIRPAARPATSPTGRPAVRETTRQTVLPVPANWPDGTSALCKNGDFSDSVRRSGTCAGKQGVAHWRYPADHPHWQQNNVA